MTFRIRPQDICIPAEDPFRNDLLGRKEPAEVLTQIICSIEGPCTLAIDAAWGNGKTTFLHLWAQHLRNLDFPVVEFNAWDTDFCGDPFLALSDAVTNGIGDRSTYKEIQLKEATKRILRRSIPSLIRLATAGIVNPDQLFGKEVTELVSSLAEERVEAYEEQQKSVLSFRDTLEQSAVDITQNDKPLVIMIDELDRCRPTYAIELLEVTKHLFSVPHIVFVLALNRSELEHSVKAVYGGDFDGSGYLRRFFDIDFLLPKPDRIKFISELIHSTRIHEYFARTMDNSARGNGLGASGEILEKFLNHSDLTLREISKSVYHLGLVFASLRSDRRSFHLDVVVALLLRAIWPTLYEKFRRGEITDTELVKSIFSEPKMERIREEREGILFEMEIIAAFMEIHSKESSLLENHRNRVTEGGDHRSEHIVNTIQFLRRGSGFKFAIERIELLSQDLIGEHAGG